MIAVRDYPIGEADSRADRRSLPMGAQPPPSRMARIYPATAGWVLARRVKLGLLLGVTSVLVVPADTVPGVITVAVLAVLGGLAWWAHRATSRAAASITAMFEQELGPHPPAPHPDQGDTAGR
jgi:hypothetical protein